MSWRIDRLLLLRAAGLTALGALAGLGVNAAHPAGVALGGFEPPTTCTAGAAEQAPILELTAHDASLLCGRAGVIFADTRPAEQFEAGHVAGALHLPCDASASGAEEAIRRLDRAATVVIYGETGDAALAVAETLRRHGLSGELRVLRGGFPAWAEQGLACASGPCPECAVAGSKESHP
ncbi:MAG: rhodanese-like domain-containing protein [Polyangiaceae bacterium]|nr:rhodanese-like domain-containing protein [Polyangiaceae bacterium]